MDSIVLSEQDVNVSLSKERSFKEYDKMDDVMGQVWVADTEDVWRLATVRSVSSDGKTLFVLEADEETTYTIEKAKTHPFDPSHAISMDDLAHLNNMHEAPLLHVLKKRFKEDKIYTVCSDVLISINPYKKIPLLYELDSTNGKPVQEEGRHPKRRSSIEGLSGEKKEEEVARPHVYTVAARAFRFMTEPNEALLLGKTVALKNQSIIISGESGAGKTEASKYVMRYLISVANALQHNKDKQQGSFIEKCLLRSNTVLEAFGNAKTLRNDNSSRFGKYIKLQYDDKRELIGAWTDHFLLEKSRLVHVDEDERNYHIFYQMLQGLDADTRKALHLSDQAQDYRILAQGHCWSLEDVDDKEEFAQVTEALTTLGVSDEEISCLWRLLAILLHLGNLEYHQEEEHNVQLSSQTVALADIAELLGTEAGALIEGITKRTTTSGGRGSVLSIPLNREQTQNNVQALIKYVYGEAFGWILRKINSCHSNMTTGIQTTSFIGILDIFGFEIMTRNSFEQLCINFANEVLQQQFNMHIFVLEQQEYVAEELDWKQISFGDNQGVIDLIAKKPVGLLIMLEEQVLLGRTANNAALLTAYNQTHAKVESYARPRFQKNDFTIKHFAGDVTYNIEGFIEKNNDSLHEDLLSLWRNSEQPFFQNLFGTKPQPGTAGYIKPLPTAEKKATSGGQLDLDGKPIGAKKEGGGGGGRPMSIRGRGGGGGMVGPGAISGAFTVSSTFRRQLEELTATLKATEPHYIKCIKPNAIKAPGGFSSNLVVQQLRYSGVLEVVRIRREAYPTRIFFEEFYKRFDVLLGSHKPNSANLRSPNDFRNACKAIVVRVLPEGGFQLGKRKIFLRDNGLDLLKNAIRDFYAGHAAKIQALIRAFLYKRRYRKSLRQIRIMQKIIRMYFLRKQYLKHRAQIVKIQARWRRARQFRYYRALKKATIIAQSHTRRMIAVNKFSIKAQELKQKMKEAATKMAALYRGFVARVWHKREVSAIRIGAGVRGFLARRQARKMRSSISVVAWIKCRLARRRYLAKKRACINLQSVARMVLAMKELKRRRAILKIQTANRAWAARKRFCSLRTQARLKREHDERQAALAIQSRYRAYQMRSQFLVQRKAVVVVQASVRCHLASSYKARAMKSILLIQTAQRRHQCRSSYLRLLAAIRLQTAATRLQTAGRRYICRRNFLQLRAAIRIQTYFRMWTVRKRYVQHKAAVSIQAVSRGYLQRLRYNRVKGIVLLQSMVRGIRVRKDYQRVRRAISTLQRTTRHFLAVVLEEKRLSKVHECARSGQARVVKQWLEEWPELMSMPDRKGNYRTLFHSAALAHDSGMMRVLNPRFKDLFARDANGDTPLHMAAERVGLDTARYLSAVCDGPAAVAYMKARLDHVGTSPRKHIGSPKKVKVHKGTFRISAIGIDSLESRRRSARETLAAAICAPDNYRAIASASYSSSRAPVTPSRGSNMSLGYNEASSSTPSSRAGGRGLVPSSPAGSLGHRREECKEEIWEGGGGRSSRRSTRQSKRTQSAPVILMQGWLRKRRETGQFQRRWCTLTDLDLTYKHEPTQAVKKVINLAGAMLKVCSHINFCFEIHSPFLLDNRNREGRLYFQAENELQLQAWLAQLHLVMGQTAHMYGRRTHPIRYIDGSAREAMVNAVNDFGETPLHALVRRPTTEEGMRRRNRRSKDNNLVEMAMWLIANGADMNAKDNNGNTVAHLAVMLADDPSISDDLYRLLLDLKDALCVCKAHFDEVNHDGYSVNALLNKMGLRKAPRGEKVAGGLAHSPSRLPGCSYVSLYVEALMMDECFVRRILSAPVEAPQAAFEKAYMVINVFSGKTQLKVEATQVMKYPCTRSSSKLSWGWRWHMQTPVEHLPPGSFAVFELYIPADQEKLGSQVVPSPKGPRAWAVIHLSDTRVDSTLVVDMWEMYAAPVDLKLRKMEPANFFLQGEMWVSQDRKLAGGGGEGRRGRAE